MMTRRYSLTARRLILVVAATLVASLTVVASAQAIVVNDGGTTYGVAVAPNTTFTSVLGSLTPVTAQNAPCPDPSLSPDLRWLTTGLVSPLCYHNGPVIHQNETYVLTWDPGRTYWATTRKDVQQFLADVGTGSGTFSSPYALLPQYFDGSGPAQNKSVYAGGCIDYGTNPSDPSQAGYTCRFGANQPSGNGYDYPADGCPLGAQAGTNLWPITPGGLTTVPNNHCLTDGQIKVELQDMLPQMGLPGGNVPGYTPLVVFLTPPGVKVCLDASGYACSANMHSLPSDPTPHVQFCSYHSQVNVGGTNIAYVVQPWTAEPGQGVGCDDPSVPNIPNPVNVTTLADDVAARLVSPISQAELAAITNPSFQGWFGNDGSEINDNGCGPLPAPLDMVAVGPTTYPLQREFNNAGAIESDPNALPCSGVVNLTPAFVVPGPVQPNDNVLFDGSVTASTLMVHNGGYSWNFGDGTTGTGPSVYHQYTKGGSYAVTLSVKDRGGNTAHITQTVTVFGSDGQPVNNNPAPGGATPGSLNVQLQLLPQSFKSVLRNGIGLRVTSNRAANGIATVWITRAAAKRAKIKVGKGPAVRIGIGTVSSITNGTVTLRLHLLKSTATKLARLGHVTLTVRLALVASGNQQSAIDAAGRY
jgi:hypothetical protein